MISSRCLLWPLNLHRKLKIVKEEGIEQSPQKREQHAGHEKEGVNGEEAVQQHFRGQIRDEVENVGGVG